MKESELERLRAARRAWSEGEREIDTKGLATLKAAVASTTADAVRKEQALQTLRAQFAAFKKMHRGHGCEDRSSADGNADSVETLRAQLAQTQRDLRNSQLQNAEASKKESVRLKSFPQRPASASATGRITAEHKSRPRVASAFERWDMEKQLQKRVNSLRDKIESKTKQTVALQQELEKCKQQVVSEVRIQIEPLQYFAFRLLVDLPCRKQCTLGSCHTVFLTLLSCFSPAEIKLLEFARGIAQAEGPKAHQDNSTG